MPFDYASTVKIASHFSEALWNQQRASSAMLLSPGYLASSPRQKVLFQTTDSDELNSAYL